MLCVITFSYSAKLYRRNNFCFVKRQQRKHTKNWFHFFYCIVVGMRMRYRLSARYRPHQRFSTIHRFSKALLSATNRPLTLHSCRACVYLRVVLLKLSRRLALISLASQVVPKQQTVLSFVLGLH